MALVSLAFGYAPPPQTTNHAAPPQTINPLVLLDTPGAQCLDGSFGGYHYTTKYTWLFYAKVPHNNAILRDAALFYHDPRRRRRVRVRILSCKYQRDTSSAARPSG